MKEEEIVMIFQFSKKWSELGIITPDVLKELEREYAKGEDPYPEHYRWRAFQSFMQRNANFDDNIAKALYKLGEDDLDSSLGGAIMVAILKRKDCPLDLLEEAAHSTKRFLAKTALQQLSKRKLSEDHS
ncbi:MAG TPA: hypothetical protein VJ464_11625 [Blastocatellia bacterium]|nr:hypothetical protein [Blastocatellia bacterium]